MRSLFVRIFLWFWLAMAIIAAVVVVTSPYWTRVRPRIAEWEQRAFSTLASVTEETAAVVAEHGPEGLEDRPRHHQRRGRWQVFLLDDRGRDLFGRDPRPAIRKIGARALASQAPEYERVGSDFFAARPAADPDGNPLIVVASLQRRKGGHGPPPHPGFGLIDPGALLPRLLVILVVAGVSCYLLARHLSSPMRDLRQATRLVASGDLSARVGSPVASRGDEIGALGRDFDAMAERIESLVGSQRRLLRDVSHELRSPLARLTVALELARQRSPEEAQGALDRIDRECVRLSELIGNLLTLNRLDAGDGTASLERVRLDQLVEAVVADAHFEASARPCIVGVVETTELWLEGSPDLLRSAIENVVRNAVRHTEPGTKVLVGLRRDPYEAVITVRDHGPGVPEEALDSLFEPFYRVAEARQRETGGTGLGLAITARAVRLHHGRARAANAAEGGLIVELRFPLGRDGT